MHQLTTHDTWHFMTELKKGVELVLNEKNPLDLLSEWSGRYVNIYIMPLSYFELAFCYLQVNLPSLSPFTNTCSAVLLPSKWPLQSIGMKHSNCKWKIYAVRWHYSALPLSTAAAVVPGCRNCLAGEACKYTMYYTACAAKVIYPTNSVLTLLPCKG